jgi:hypothetical protein
LMRRLRKRSGWAGLDRSSSRQPGQGASWLVRYSRTAAVALAIWFVCNSRHHVTCPNAAWRPDQAPPHPGRPLGAGLYGWICLLGLAGSLVATVVLAKRSSRSANQHPVRYAARLVRLVPAALVGAFCGVAWSLTSWGPPAVTAALFLLGCAVLARLLALRRRRLYLYYFLAMLLGFAMLSGNIVPDKRHWVNGKRRMPTIRLTEIVR